MWTQQKYANCWLRHAHTPIRVYIYNIHIIYIYILYIPVVPARGGAEVALKIYMRPFSSNYRTCMRRAPAKPVRACTLRNWCLVSHVTFEAPLRTSHFSVQSSHYTLRTPHFTLHSSHCTLRSQHFTSHCTLKTPHFTLHTHTLHTPHFTLHSSHSKLHTSHSTLHTSQSTLHTSHCFLHTPNFTLHTALFTIHTSHCTLHTPHFISAELFSPYPSWSLLISSLLICRLSFQESLPSITTNHCRSLDAATPIRFTRSSCKRQ